MSRQADLLIESYNRQWTVDLGVCPHGYKIVEEHDKDDIPGFRCHDIWVVCDCPECSKLSEDEKRKLVKGNI